uniref:Putative secreted protein n=1 Tax=Xenopsylla cheopis TaxID=163159 RepID=A0A6M2DWJ8_XENCH
MFALISLWFSALSSLIPSSLVELKNRLSKTARGQNQHQVFILRLSRTVNFKNRVPTFFENRFHRNRFQNRDFWNRI